MLIIETNNQTNQNIELIESSSEQRIPSISIICNY